MTALEHTPLPESCGSRLPPPPPVKTTFAGAGGEGDPSERILADQAHRLIRSVPTIASSELPSHLRSLRHIRERVERELARVRLIESTPTWTIWLSAFETQATTQDAATLLIVTLRAIDEAIEATQQRMRDLFMPSFASELM